MLTRRRRRNLVASVRASMSQELSTPCACRVNNQILAVPAASRAITTNAPASQASDSAIFQSKPFREDASGFGVASNRDEPGFEAGDSVPIFKGWL